MMAFVLCEWFYEHILGDNCNNKCDQCFGDNDIRIYKHDIKCLDPIDLLLDVIETWDTILRSIIKSVDKLK